MALKVKAVERLVKFNKEDEGVWRYVMSPDLYIALNQSNNTGLRFQEALEVLPIAAAPSVCICQQPLYFHRLLWYGS